MSSETNSPNQDPKGLPPVEPPSGKFIAQLFLIPFLIVAVLAIIGVGLLNLITTKRTPEYFLKNLDNPNVTIRWTTASDLAQVLKRPESLELASDPNFSLDLAERLRIALEDLQVEEAKALKRMKLVSKKEDKDREWLKLQPQQDYVFYLISTLGGFAIPTGAPLLGEIAASEEEGDPHDTLVTLGTTFGLRSPLAKAPLIHKVVSWDNRGNGRILQAIISRKRNAVFALANLGKSQERFSKLPEAKRTEVLLKLEKETNNEGDRGKWARIAYDYLSKKKPAGVDKQLAVAAKSRDQFLRELVAVSLNYWEGDLVEPTLELLAQDNGYGYRNKPLDNKK